MRTNVRPKPVQNYTYEGAKAAPSNPEIMLRRLTMANLLWEDSFYIDGQSTAGIIKECIPKCRPDFVAACAWEARSNMKLRHLPLLLVREMARVPTHKHLVGALLADVIQRPDEIPEFLSIYWQDNPNQPLSKQVKLGLAAAFTKFNEYQLAKYDRPGKVRLRDALFLCHSNPAVTSSKKGKKHPCKYNGGKTFVLRHSDTLYTKLIEGTLASPETWENRLSRGEDPKTVFTELMVEKKLGALAFLRNLRNMVGAGISRSLIQSYADTMNVSRVLPFRFMAAARAVPQFEDILEPLMLRCVAEQPKMNGKTILLVDHSGSMDAPVSSKSDLTRFDAACALAILLREICEEVDIYAFSTFVKAIPPRRGFALADSINRSMPPGGTHLGAAVSAMAPCDRLIVLTDEQSHDSVTAPRGSKNYMINVATNKYGVGHGNWNRIDGWSEAIVDYIQAFESSETPS